MRCTGRGVRTCGPVNGGREHGLGGAQDAAGLRCLDESIAIATKQRFGDSGFRGFRSFGFRNMWAATELAVYR
jgi:hypothetical protein